MAATTMQSGDDLHPALRVVLFSHKTLVQPLVEAPRARAVPKQRLSPGGVNPPQVAATVPAPPAPCAGALLAWAHRRQLKLTPGAVCLAGGQVDAAPDQAAMAAATAASLAS
jgi:hypothetical protein